MEVVELARDSLNPELELLAVVLNIANMRTKHARQTLEALRERFGDKVCRTVIRQSIAYAESAERAVPILDYRPDRGADYLSLAGELLRRLARQDLLERLDELSTELVPAGRAGLGRGGRPARAARRAASRRWRSPRARPPRTSRRSATEPVLDPGAEGLLAAFEGALPETGAGAPAALAELAERGAAGGDPLQRAALLSLRHGRHHAGRAGGRLAHLGARPDAPSAGRPRRSGSKLEAIAVALAARAVRAAGRSSAACWSPARRWPTSPAWSRRAAGGPSGSGSTSTRRGLAALRAAARS